MTAQLETMAGLSIPSIPVLAEEAAGAYDFVCSSSTRNCPVNADATDSQVFTALLKLMTVA